LESALELTADGGRVVLGSWYGSRPVTVRNLGSRFHRSHVSIIASQVSTLPAALTATWSKRRRMELVWELVEELKPSETLITHKINIRAQNQHPRRRTRVRNAERPATTIIRSPSHPIVQLTAPYRLAAPPLLLDTMSIRNTSRTLLLPSAMLRTFLSKSALDGSS